MNKLKLAVVATVIALGAVVVIMSKPRSSVILETNIEALTQSENPVLDNTHMYIWWVTEHFGGEAITCTLGGDLPCE